MASLSLGLGEERAGDPDFRLDVGSVIRRTFGIWAANLVSFSLVGLVAYLPALVLIALLAAAGSLNHLGVRVVDFLGNILNLILAGAVTYGVFRDLHGERAGAREVLGMGLSRLGGVWVTGVLMGVAVLVGLIALIVPGIVLLVRYWVAVPVAVIEAPGATASLSRSTELTQGNRWRVFAIAVVMGFVTIVGMFVLGILLALLDTAGSKGAASQAATSPLSLAALTVLAIPLQCLAAVAPVVAYHDLRVGREGAAVEDLLKVFE
jgi:hypothetical protein